MEYSCLMERAEEFYREVALEYYNNFAGLSERFALVEIVQKYPELFDEATYRDAMALTDAQLDSYELRELKSFVTGNLFTAELKELVEAKEQKEAALTVEYEGESVAYRSMPVKVANEPDAARRREMDVKLRGALSGELNPFYVQMSDKTFEITERLGYANYTEMTKQLLGLKLEELRESLLALIADTWELYVARLEEYAGSRLGLSPSQLEQCDVGYLFRASQFDDLFPAERMVPALTTTLAGMGIDLDKQENVTLDLEKRPKKSPRAFCIGIEVPQDVRLVLSPIGGMQDYQTLFHEAGHLEFCAHMEAELPFLFRHEGDTSVHETFAFLFQYLVSDPVWLADVLGHDEGRVGEFVRVSRLQKLYFLRRYGSKLDYELGFWKKLDLPAAEQSYVNTLSSATGFRYYRERYLADFDGGYYVAKYLQAWLAEAILRERLRDEFGETWYRSRGAGDFLRDI